jgi:hypothetical protein
MRIGGHGQRMKQEDRGRGKCMGFVGGMLMPMPAQAQPPPVKKRHIEERTTEELDEELKKLK